MKRFTGHQEPWGEFVDAKVNAPQVLRRQLKRAKPGTVLLSSVTDPYQPLEKTYRLTRDCLEALLEYDFSVDLLTRSPLCLRDLDLIRQFKKIDVGFSLGTHDERTKTLFEPHSPSLKSRVAALRTLRRAGVETYAFIGPMLPLDPRALVSLLDGAVGDVLIDRMNYTNKVKAIYRRAGLQSYLEDDYFRIFGTELKERFEEKGATVSMIF
jgi:DNA repair photolyase